MAFRAFNLGQMSQVVLRARRKPITGIVVHLLGFDSSSVSCDSSFLSDDSFSLSQDSFSLLLGSFLFSDDPSFAQDDCLSGVILQLL